MKKNLSLILAMLLIFTALAGCAASPPAEESPSPVVSDSPAAEESPALETDSFTLATLKGPTTMGLVKLLDDSSAGALSYTAENTIYGTPDEITTLLSTGKVDMACIPANLASVIYNKTEGKIQVAAINTLGVLYVIELGESINSIADLAGKTVYSTGKGTTPEFAFNAILRANDIDPETGLTVEYKSESTEIAALLAGDNAKEGTIAILPQPYAATVLAKNPNARIALSLTDEWEQAGIDGRLLTGVLVVNAEFAAANPNLLAAFLSDYKASVDWVNDKPEGAAELVAAAGLVPESAIALKALPYCNIVFIDGSEMKADLASYLQVLFDQFPASVGGKMPDDGFYYNA